MKTQFVSGEMCRNRRFAFAEMEVKSSYSYPADYRIREISEQVNLLQGLSPRLGFADEQIASQPLPPNAEGWFAIPRWELFAPTYGEAVEVVLAMIMARRSFHNYRKNKLEAEFLRQHVETAKMFQIIGSEQNGQEILVVPAQFGLHHRGRSVRQAREVFFSASEFGLGAFAVGIMLLTHPERLENDHNLWIDCAGDEYSLNANGVFENTPCFISDDNEICFSEGASDSANEIYGSASAFHRRPS